MQPTTPTACCIVLELSFGTTRPLETRKRFLFSFFNKQNRHRYGNAAFNFRIFLTN
ncbi:hypothetical protein Hanom_Chr11g00971651 [Helianthus anomalus]